jgi:hypothetical protein
MTEYELMSNESALRFVDFDENIPPQRRVLSCAVNFLLKIGLFVASNKS